MSQLTESNQTLSEQTYQALVSMIMTHELAGGQVIEERPMSKMLNVSRTPLKIALSRLLGEGLTTRLSNGLYVVNVPSTEDYLQILEVRRLLEAHAAERAATSFPADVSKRLRERIAELLADETKDLQARYALDDWFHDEIAKAAQNGQLEQMIGDIRRRARMCNIKHDSDRFRHTCDEHIAILDSLDRKDAAAARAAMEAHLDAVWSGFLQRLQRR